MTDRSDYALVRDCLHLLGKFEDMPSQWPDGPEVFPGAVNRAYLAPDRIVGELGAFDSTLREVFSHLVAITPHKQGCDEPDDPGCPGCVVNSEFARLLAGEFVSEARVAAR